VCKVIAAGHGPATYNYGFSWFTRCLEAVGQIENEEMKITAISVRAANVLEGKDWSKWMKE